MGQAVTRLRIAGRRFGRLPAALVVGSAFALFQLSSVLMPDAVTTGLGWTLPPLLLLYTCVRCPQRGVVFAVAMAPNVAAVTLAEIGGSAWLGWALMVPALLVLAGWDIADRGVRRLAASGHA